MAPPVRALQQYLEGRRAAMVDLLAELVRAESPSDIPEAQQGVQRLLADALIEIGYEIRKIPGERTGGHLLALPEDRYPDRPIQLLLGHCDTVWPIGTLRKMPLEVRDGKLYGPGSYDMKAGLVQGIFALAAVRALGTPLEVLPVLLVNSDEEIGSFESTETIRALARQADRVFVLEPSLGPRGALKTARKGVGHFVVRVTGQAAHAGLDPEKGASAILGLSYVVQRLFAINDPEHGVTVNVGRIDGGLRANVIAPESRADVDVRVLNRADAKRVEEAIFALQPEVPGTRLEISGGFGRPPMEKTPGNRKLWSLALHAADQLGLELTEATAGGGSDGNMTSQFAPTLDGLGAVGDGAHALDECVVIEKMIERSALVAALLQSPRVGRQSGLQLPRTIDWQPAPPGSKV